MPRNGSGVYSAPAGGTYPASSGTLIEAAKFNTLIADMITALTESVARDGQTVTTANIPMAGFKITGLGNGTAANDAATVYQTLGTPQWCGTAGGTADALTLTPSPALGAYAAGVTFRFKSGASPNTGATTVNISGLGAIAIQLNGAALAASDIEANRWYQITLSDAATAQLQKIGFDNVDYLPLTGGTVTGPINEAEGGSVASAATINLDSATGNFLHVTGTTTITAVTLAQGAERTVVFDGILTLTNGANLVIPGGANITTAVGDVAIFRGEGSSITRITDYVRADGRPIIGADAATQAQMEAASSNTVAATPGNMNWHPGVAKVWAHVSVSSGVPTLETSLNITSITDAGVGTLIITVATDFSTNRFAPVANVNNLVGQYYASVDIALDGAAYSIYSSDAAGTLQDPYMYFTVAFGDQ